MIYPVVLCGGSGTRLWPLSRKSFPKQFAALTGERSLFQATALRVATEGFAPPVVVTGEAYRFIVAEELRAAGREAGAILIEPEARNTAPAVLAAALHLAAEGPEALMLVLPSDHVVPDAAAFRAAVAAGVGAARAGRIVTFGVVPSRAETGYGWLEPAGTGTGTGTGPVPLRRFVEKPDAEGAARMLASGCLWNSGVFLFSVATILAAFAAHAPGLMAPVEAALRGARRDLGFLRLAAAPWGGVEAISVDHAVMERAEGLVVVPFGGAWADLGGWEAVAAEMPKDAAGNAVSGAVTVLDCERSVLRSEEAGVELVGLGLRGIVAVATGDAVLVADAARGQEVRQVVEALRAKGARQAERTAREHRPWGWFQTLAGGERFQVKRIVVEAGAALSLQSHLHRAEHWVVVSGTARVTIGDAVRLVSENESVYVPLGAVHRLENPGKVAVHLIEVQTGAYLGEDDITRYDDVYARGAD